MEMDENQKFSLSMDTIQSLKCAFCDSYLTIAPIMITSPNGNEWKCGRCTSITTDYNVPALLFETVAMSMTFPCTYPGCSAKLPWDNVKRHEDACRYQPVKCPCGETVEFFGALGHFRDQHPEIVSYNRAIVENPGYCKLLTRLIMVNTVSFMVYILCERKSEIRVAIYSLDDTADSYEAQLKLTTNSNDCVITLPNKKISKYRLRDHCADCLLKTCPVRCHKYYESNKNMVIDHVYEMMTMRINTLSVLNILNSDEFVLTISVAEETNLANQEVIRNKNEQVRKAWECQLCQEYLVGLIFICPTGHSLCDSCKDKIAECPYCLLALGDSRNYKLEEMAECTEIVCQYEASGCNFTGSIKRVARHEHKCRWNKNADGPSKKKMKVASFALD